MSFELPKLPYAYDALEPHIDAKTMEIHHSKHHQAYTTNLNNAIAGTALEGQSLLHILQNCKDKPAVRNNGGGYWNHNLFWEIMSPNGGGNPAGNLSVAIDETFGSYESFKEKFAAAATTRNKWRIRNLLNSQSRQSTNGRGLRGHTNSRIRCMGARVLFELPK